MTLALATKPNVKGAPLNERALLAELSIGVWEGRRRDRNTGKGVIADAHAESNAGAWWTYAIPKDAKIEIQRAADASRAEHYRLTLPWADEGPRILPATLFMDYREVMRKHHDRFDAAVDGFVDRYPQLVADAPARLGNLYNAKYFTDASKVRNRFRWNTQFLPLPVATDFRVDLGDEITAQVRANIVSTANSAIDNAMGNVWKRLYEVVSKMSERLGDGDKIFRDSLVSNIVELSDLLPKLNITGDPDLERLRQEVVSRLTAQDPTTLRENKSVRANVATAADDILKQIGQFFTPEPEK